MSPRRKRQLYNLFGILLSAYFLYYCFHSLDREALRQIFAVPRPWLLLTVVALNFVVMAVRTQIWKDLVNPLTRINFSTLFDIIHLGYMANNLLPLKAGEFFRASFVAKKWKIPYTQVLTTVGLERYFAGFSLMLLFFVVTFFLQVPLWIKTGAYGIIAVLISVQISLLFLWIRKPDLKKWEMKHPILYRIILTFSHIGEGSQPLRSGKSFLWLLLLALLAWVAQLAMLKLIESAYNLHLPVMASLFVLVAINLAIALPSAPGNLGTFEFASVLAYSFIGVDKATGLGIGIFFHFLQAIPITLVGFFYYYRWGIRLKDMERVAENGLEEAIS